MSNKSVIELEGGASLFDQLLAKGGVKQPSAKEKKTEKTVPLASKTQAIKPKATFQLPKIKLISEMSLVTKVKDQAEINEEVENFKSAVTANLEWLYEHPSKNARRGTPGEAIFADDQETFVIEVIRKVILRQEHPKVRQLLTREFAKLIISTTPGTFKDVRWTVDCLIEAQFLVDSKNGHNVCGANVELGVNYQDRDSRQIAEGLSNLDERAREARKADMVAQKKAIEEAAGPEGTRLSVDQLFKKDGLGLFTDPGWEDRNGYYHLGGKVLVESVATDGVYIALVEGTGKLAELAREAVERNIAITLQDLKSGRVSNGQMQQDLADVYYKVFKTLQRTLDHEWDLKESYEKDEVLKAEAEVERTELREMETLTAAQFHQTAEDGSYLVTSLGHWPYTVIRKDNSGKSMVDRRKSFGRKVVFQTTPVASEVFFLAVRKDGKLVDPVYPERLKKFFAKYPDAFDKLIRMDKKHFEQQNSKVKEQRSVEAEVRREQEAEEFDKNFESEMLAADTELKTEAVVVEAVDAKPTKATRNRRAKKAKVSEV